MTNYARIEGNKVAELLCTEGDITEMFHPDLKWVPCMEGVEAGWLWSEGEGFSPPADSPPESHDDVVARALALLRSERAPILLVLDGLQASAGSMGLAALVDGDAATAGQYSARAADIESLKQALKDAPAAINPAQFATFEEMRQAGKAYYATLVAAAPVEIRSLFNELV